MASRLYTEAPDYSRYGGQGPMPPQHNGPVSPTSDPAARSYPSPPRHDPRHDPRQEPSRDPRDRDPRYQQQAPVPVQQAYRQPSPQKGTFGHGPGTSQQGPQRAPNGQHGIPAGVAAGAAAGAAAAGSAGMMAHGHDDDDDVLNMYAEEEPARPSYGTPRGSIDSDHHVSEVKPPPRRNYEHANGSTSTLTEAAGPKPLTVQDFETMRTQARNQPQNLKLQLDVAKKYVEAASTLANKYSDPNTPSSGGVDPKVARRNADQWMSTAYKMTKKLASNHYPDAIFYLGTCYSSGTMGLEADYDKAYELYHKAGKLDHPEATYREAVCNEIGAGTRRDPAKALHYYRKAASLGDVSAMYKLGMISLNGLLGQRRSFTEAITWLQRAADKADPDTPHAVHELGLLYERADALDLAAMGEDGKPIVFVKDEQKAYELFLKAAKLGYPPSQFRLGCAYEYGTLGCQINPKRSIAWYSKAAEKGEPESELALSGWYLTGSEGILQQSDTEAYLWARKAAEKGLAKAEYALGYFSEVGLGVRADIDEAKRWYYKAAAQKHPKALARLQELKQQPR